MLSDHDTAPPRGADRPAATADRTGRQLAGGLLTALLLTIPLRAAISTTTYGGLYLWVLLAVVIVVGFGLLLRWTGVPGGLAVAVATAGCYGVAVMLMLGFVAWVGDPGGDTGVAVLVSVTAAAIAVPVAVGVLRRAGDAAPMTAGLMCAVGLVVAAISAPSVWNAVDDVREDEARVAAFEAAGVRPYLPEIDGLDPEYSSTALSAETGVATGYTLRYRASGAGDAWDAASIDVRVSPDADPLCADSTRCREGDGYLVYEDETGRRSVSAAVSPGYLVATYNDGTGDLPGVDTVGAALAHAEPVEWDDVLRLRD